MFHIQMFCRLFFRNKIQNQIIASVAQVHVSESRECCICTLYTIRNVCLDGGGGGGGGGGMDNEW